MPTSLRKILLIRHAEKPVPELGIGGVDERGSADRRSLSVRGWQRAGALVRFFAPRDGVFAHDGLERPDALFAASPRTKSRRPLQTLSELAQELDLPVRQEYDSECDEARLVAAARDSAGVALISWRQDAMAPFARRLLGDDALVPDWPKSRFDVVWVFTRHAGGWTFDQVPQCLLPGDRAETMAVPVLADQ